jgi:PAS domain-containing protein
LGAYDYIIKLSYRRNKNCYKIALEHHSLILEKKNYEQELKQKIKEATKQLENTNKELRETKEYLEQLLNTSVDGIFILTPDFQVSYANQGALNILEISEKEILTENLSAFLSAQQKKQNISISYIYKMKNQNTETEQIRKIKHKFSKFSSLL